MRLLDLVLNDEVKKKEGIDIIIVIYNCIVTEWILRNQSYIQKFSIDQEK